MGEWESYEKTYPSVSLFASVNRFAEQVQLKGLRPRTVEAYVAVVRQLGEWAGGDPAGLAEERVRAYFLHLLNERGYAPQSMRQARVALAAFYVAGLGRAAWRVFAAVAKRDRDRLPVGLSPAEVRGMLRAAAVPVVKVEPWAVPCPCCGKPLILVGIRRRGESQLRPVGVSDTS